MIDKINKLCTEEGFVIEFDSDGTVMAYIWGYSDYHFFEHFDNVELFKKWLENEVEY